MYPTEQARFFETINQALGAYGKFPERRELEAWWGECRSLTLEGLQVALKAHRDDPDRGERAPRPVDLTRRLKTGNRDEQRCAATDMTGRCEYPGIFSDGTMGEGPHYCPWHRTDRSGPDASAWIERSRNIPFEVARAKRIDRMNTEAQGTAAVRHTAHAIALRHGQKPWQGNAMMSAPNGYRQDEEAA